MNYQQALEQKNIFIDVLSKKMEASYPDIWVKSRTKDEETWRNANGSMYTWYIMICNSFNINRLSPKYTLTNDEAINSEYERIGKFVNDFKNAENWQSFLFENMHL